MQKLIHPKYSSVNNMFIFEWDRTGKDNRKMNSSLSE